jgi:hypothetical protein
MGYAEKMAEGLTAKGLFSQDDVTNLIGDIIEAMGKKATVFSDDGSGTIQLGFIDKYGWGGTLLDAAVAAATKSFNADMLALADIDEANGVTKVSTSIVDANVSQTKLLYFIPISPKKVHALNTFRDFNDHLKEGLLNLDNSASVNISERG